MSVKCEGCGADTEVPYCGGCVERAEESGFENASCEHDEPTEVVGGLIREWASVEKSFGRITLAEFELLNRCAEDLEGGR